LSRPLIFIKKSQLFNHHEDHEGPRRLKFDKLSNRVIGCAIEVHRNLGPGLLESTYEQCLAHELKCAAIHSCYNILFRWITTV
jgi:hypothetical protein